MSPVGFADLPLLSQIKGRLSWLDERQRVIAQNVANADTPGYASRDLNQPTDFARALAEAAHKRGRSPRILVQVNTGAEPQKAGVPPEAADAMIASARDVYGLTVEGLMCIPPEGADSSPHFAMLAGMAARNGLSGLSMGMSGDFEAAIAEGATHVRVGSALFGTRVSPA